MRDQADDIEIRLVTAPVDLGTGNTASVGTVIDCVNRGSLTFVTACGSLADADATFTVLVEDSPDNSTFTAVDDTYLIGTEAGASFTFASDSTVHKIGYIGPQRYVRQTITPANNTGAVLISVIAILGLCRYLPRSTQTA